MFRYASDIIYQITGSAVRSQSTMAGGCVGDVYRVTLENGEQLVAKLGDAGSGLDIEGGMLRFLRRHSELPVPEVHYADDRLLVMELLAHNAPLSAASQADAARHLARLHAISNDHFGFEYDTLIGTLTQPNPPSSAWVPYFRDHRLLYMARIATEAGRLPSSVMTRVLRFADHLDRFLIEPEQPSLIHGDMWTGNVLCFDNKISGFIDPALYFADAEIELAYSTLFSTFGEPFFKAYQEIRPLKPGFFEGRRDIYNLYPLLVHVRLFGGSYVLSVETTLKRFGF